MTRKYNRREKKARRKAKITRQKGRIQQAIAKSRESKS